MQVSRTSVPHGVARSATLALSAMVGGALIAPTGMLVGGPLSLAAVARPPAQGRQGSYVVRAVPDGATIVVGDLGRVALLGIEVPRPPRGSRRGASTIAALARRRLTELVVGRWVRIEWEGDQASPTGRRAGGYVFRDDGLFVNERLVREGLARVEAGELDTTDASSRAAALGRAEADARRWRVGLWGGEAQGPRPRLQPPASSLGPRASSLEPS